MLVLSRRQHQKLVLPDCQTTIEVVHLQRSQVRLGITAPPHVRILREELTGGETRPAVETPDSGELRRLRHLLRNQVQTSTIGLALLRRQMELGNYAEVEATLAKLENELSRVREQCRSLEAPPPVATRGPRRALLVEDNQNERELLASFLRMSGFEVATAGDGADALDYLQSHTHPDVMLLDMMMPRCDGPTTVRQIRSNPQTARLKIFAVSGALPQELALTDGPVGVDGWFPKPVDPNTLVAAMNRAVDLAARDAVQCAVSPPS